jgi:amino acid transporter
MEVFEMSVEAPGLKRNAIGLPEILFQGITHIAPAAGLIFTLPFIASYTGAAMPIALALSLIVCLLIASTVAEFTKYLPSSGGYFTFVARGLGPVLGFMTAWCYFIYDPLGGAANLGILSGIGENFIQGKVGVDIPWWAMALVGVAVVWALTYFGIKMSGRSLVILGSIELLIMIALGLALFLSPASGSSVSSTMSPSSAPTGINGILYGMVYSILAISGFEAIAPLAEETRNPAKIASKAILGSLLIVGIYYVVMSVAVAVGWGTDKMGDFSTATNPFFILADRVLGVGSWLVFLALINSALGVSIASVNAGTRVIYAMSRIGVLPKWFGYIDPQYRTPTHAISFLTAVTVALIVVIGAWQGPANVYGLLGATITVGIIIMYSLANISLYRFMRAEHPDQYNPFRHLIVPVVGTLMLLPVLWVTFYPVPAFPFNLVPYAVIVWLVIGAVVAWRLSRNSPEAMSQASKTFLDSEAELD